MFYRSISLFVMTITTVFFSSLMAQDNYGGLALYTLREELKENPKEVLKEVANVGYAYIESAGYEDGKFYGMEPKAFRAYLKEIGLHPMSTHMAMITPENADQLIADAKAAGFTYFVIPIPPMGMFTFDPQTRQMGMNGTAKELADLLNTFGEKCNKAGLKLLYHNHDFEYLKDANGNTIIDYLLQHCNPEYVNFQMDLYWVTKAGADPVAYFQKYPGRFKIWHVKDMDDQGRFAPVGTGSIDFKRILENKELSGLECFFVEQDATFNETPSEAIKISRKGLDHFGFNTVN